MFKWLLSSQLRVNMVASSTAAVVDLIVVAIAYPLYLHFLGYEKYGVWLILATVLTLAQLGNLGISSAVMKLIAEEYGHGNTKGIQNYLTTGLAILLLSGTLALILILLFRNRIITAFNLSGENAVIALQLLPYIAFLSVYVMLVQVLNSAISGLGRMDMAKYIVSCSRVVTVGTSLILLSLGKGIESLLIGNVLSYIFVGAASFLFIRKTVKMSLFRTSNLDSRSFRKLMRFGGGVFSGSLINMVLHPFNKLMLSRYAGISSIPVYEIAFNGSMKIRGLFEVGLRALLPEISRIGANMTKYARDRISQINRRSIRIVLAGGLPLYGLIILFCAPLLKLWLREDFSPLLPTVLRIMLVGTFLGLLCVPAYYTLLGLERVRYCLYSNAIQTGANIIIVLGVIVLSSELAVSDVAWAVLVAMTLTSMYVLFQKHRMITAIAQPKSVG